MDLVLGLLASSTGMSTQSIKHGNKQGMSEKAIKMFLLVIIGNVRKTKQILYQYIASYFFWSYQNSLLGNCALGGFLLTKGE